VPILDLSAGVGVFAAGYLCGWIVGVVRHRRGRISVTVVSDAEPPPDAPN